MREEQAELREIGRRLRVWRARLGVNQKEVADLVEATQPTISRIEGGKIPRYSLAQRIEELISRRDGESDDDDAEIICTIARSNEFRALVKRIAEALNE